VGLLVSALARGFIRAHGLAAQAGSLSWTAFFARNLLPVTVGNPIGGTVLVGLVYWSVHLRPRPASQIRC
jgi:formate transporter